MYFLDIIISFQLNLLNYYFNEFKKKLIKVIKNTKNLNNNTKFGYYNESYRYPGK